jgi:hypothetical protein
VNRFLLVEGKAEVELLRRLDVDDAHGWFVSAACVNDAKGIPKRAQLFFKEDAFEAAVANRSLRSVGLLFDAEDDPSARAAWMRSALEVFGLPSELAASATHGAVIEHEGVRYGFFVSPDGVSQGSIEGLLARSLPPDLRVCVDGLFGCPNVQSRLSTWSPGQRDKAWMEVAARVTRPPVAMREAKQEWRASLSALFDTLSPSPEADPGLGALRSFLADLG